MTCTSPSSSQSSCSCTGTFDKQLGPLRLTPETPQAAAARVGLSRCGCCGHGRATEANQVGHVCPTPLECREIRPLLGAGLDLGHSSSYGRHPPSTSVTGGKAFSAVCALIILLQGWESCNQSAPPALPGDPLFGHVQRLMAPSKFLSETSSEHGTQGRRPGGLGN